MEATLRIKVIPRASRNRVLIREGEVVVYVTAPPEKGKANKKVLKLLKKLTGANVKMVSGEKSREKIITFSIEKAEFMRRLAHNGRAD